MSNPAVPRPRRRRWPILVVAVLAAVGAYLFTKWRDASFDGGQIAVEPFRIAGNFYYVGANDVAAFLITSPHGHVLIDGGYPGTAPLILASVARLGFDIRDVKLLLNSEPHFDHAGGLGALQRASGAKVWASEASAPVLEAGGDDPVNFFPVRLLVRSGIMQYPPLHVDHRFRDGDTIRVGPTTIVAHLTPGHTRGCTSYAFDVMEGDRPLHVVSACSLIPLGGSRYPAQGTDFTHTFAVLRSLPADVWVTSHARLWGRYRKFAARDTATSKIEPFIDPAGYRAYVDSGEARFKRGRVQ